MHDVGSKLESWKTKIQRLSINIRESYALVKLVFETIKDCWRKEKGYFILLKGENWRISSILDIVDVELLDLLTSNKNR